MHCAAAKAPCPARETTKNRRAASALTFLLISLLSARCHAEVTAPETLPSRPAEKGCQWKKLQSANPVASILVQDCDYGFRKISHAFESSAVVEKFSDSPSGERMIELFRTSVNASPAEVLHEHFVKNLNEYERKHCVVRKADPRSELEKPLKSPRKSAWEIAPDREYSKKILKETPKGDIPKTACGTHGVPTDSRAYFEFHEGSEVFAWVIAGQDTPLFDEQSLEF